jgi:hypothetical protein
MQAATAAAMSSSCSGSNFPNLVSKRVSDTPRKRQNGSGPDW